MEAIYDYEATCSGELSFRQGDMIRVTDVDIGSSSWWEGESMGMIGQFPRSYVEPVVPPIRKQSAASSLTAKAAMPPLVEGGAYFSDARKSSAAGTGSAIEGSKDLMLHRATSQAPPPPPQPPLDVSLHGSTDSSTKNSTTQPIVQTASELNFD